MRKPTSDGMEKVVLSLCEQIDSPRSLSVWLCYKYSPEELFHLSMPDTATCDTAAFQLDYFITEYLSKYKGLKAFTEKQKSQLALDRWIAAESQCLKTNRRFRRLNLEPFTSSVSSTLFRAQRKISSVLGTLKISKVLEGCRWGPGATFDLKRIDAFPDKKISNPISVTPAALVYLRAVVESDPRWASLFTGEYPSGPFCLTKDFCNIVRGSRFLTVPKTAKVDRCIAAEPTGNSFLQQGVHHYMRRRLKQFGVDLDKQSINQNRARDAYLSGLSTLDLSSASDTISTELIYNLLPLDWALFLDSLRSPETLVNGEWIRTEKFGSMGNAFVFELETLIFWALSGSVAENLDSMHGQVTVYGDDIIVPRTSYDAVREILTTCGFTLNEKKSFRDGNFYESCGKHYHCGSDVTPVYQKEPVKAPPEIIRAHNRLSRLTDRLFSGDPHKVTRSSLRVFAEMYPLKPFPRIPKGCTEDGGFLRPLGDFHPDPNHGYKCCVLDYKPRFVGASDDAMYSYKLRHASTSNPLSEDVPQPVWPDDRTMSSVETGLIGRIRRKQEGYTGNASQGSWRSTTRWIPLKATLLIEVQNAQVEEVILKDHFFRPVLLAPVDYRFARG